MPKKLPDNDHWTNRIEIEGSTGNVYIVAQNKTGRYWGCDCPGYKSRKLCKHLKSIGVPGNFMAFELKKDGDFASGYRKTNKTGDSSTWEKAADLIRPPTKIPEKAVRKFDFGDEEEKAK